MTKLEILKNEIKNLGNLAVAFSGGVDSSFLLKVAHDALSEKAIAITIKSPYMSAREIDEAVKFCEIYGIKQEVFEVEILDEIRYNPQDRCYICKKAVFARLIALANELGFTNIADGTNKDDLSEHRPGLRAKTELGVLSPLINLSKNDIRELSRELNLPTANKPSYACLLTRLPYEREFNESEIKLIEKVENLLISNGFLNIRARFDGKTFKLQMGENETIKFTSDPKFKAIVRKIANLGEYEITLDLKGLRGEILNDAQ